MVSSGAEMNPNSDRRGIPARVLGSLLAQARVAADYKFLAERCGVSREELDAVMDDQANSGRHAIMFATDLAPATISGAQWIAPRTNAADVACEMRALKDMFGSARAATARVRFLDSLRSDLSECNEAIA